MEILGYRSRSEICPIRYLPQTRDSLCILWSLFLLRRQCERKDPYIKNTNERSQEFRQFISDVWQLAQKWLPQYYRFQQYMIDLSLNNIEYSYQNERSSFTAALDKEEWLSKRQRFSCETSIERTPYEAAFLRYIVQYIYEYSYDLGRRFSCTIKDKGGIEEIIEQIPSEIPQYYVRYLIYMILAILSLESNNRMDIFYGRNQMILEKYVYRYRRIIEDLVRQKFGTIDFSRINDYKLMEMVEDQKQQIFS